MDALLNPDLREKEHDGSIKVENTSTQVIFKGLAPRVVLSNHFLAKGAKTKVNLEEQGRQKVSFSFTQTKKPLQNVFLAPPSPEKASPEICSTTLSANLPSPDQARQSAESKNEQLDVPAVITVVAESQATHSPVILPAKSKHDLGKIHFKKQILSVSIVEESPTAHAVSDQTFSETDVLISSSASIETESLVTQSQQNTISDSPPEKADRDEGAQEKLDICLKGPTDSSHIGKEYKDRPSISEPEDRKAQPQSVTALPGSEFDGDSVRTSSSLVKCSDPKNLAKSDSQSTDVKKSSSSKSEVLEKSKYDRREEKDEKGSNRSKMERDSRHTSSRSSRSDRRRTKSRSRSRSRSSRTSSSYSRSERSRNERQSRSDRSHYHDSERRSHRSSPYREQRSSRSRADGRSRESSDSEDDLRKPRTRGSDSSRSSTYSTSQRDSKTSSYSRSYRDSKSIESSRSLESDRRSQYSRTERSGRPVDSEPSKRTSPESESIHKKSSSLSKSEITAKFSTSNQDTFLRSEKTTLKNSVSSDSDEEHRRKSQSQGSDRSSGSWSSSCKRTDILESKSSASITGTDGQSVDTLNSNVKVPLLRSQGEFIVDVSQHEDGSQFKLNNNSSQQKQQAILTDKSKSENIELQVARKDPGSTEKSPVLPDERTNIDGELSTTVSKCHVTVKEISVQGAQLGNQTDTLVQNEIQVFTEAQINVANVSNLCKSNYSSSLNKLSCPGYTSSDDSPQSLADTLSVKELPLDPLKPNTKSGSHLIISKEVSQMAITQNVNVVHKEPHQLNVKPEQPQADVLKMGSNFKKSRWDIVGQDTSESQAPKKMVNQDTSVKKVISVKRIEFNNDVNFEDVYSEKQHSVMQPIKPEDVAQRNGKTTSLKEISQVPSQPFDCGIQPTHDSSNEHVDAKTSANKVLECPLKSCHNNATAFQIDQTFPNFEKLNNDDSHKPVTRDSASFGCDGKDHSEESETDDYDSDSDDGQVSLKRLHSVVVVPKNSTITLETTDHGVHPTPSPSPSDHFGQQLTHQAGQLNKDIRSESPHSLSSQSKLGDGLAEGNKHVLLVANDKCSPPPAVRVAYQSQSNMVDSTSHSEATTILPATDRNCIIYERPKMSVPTGQMPTYCLENVQKEAGLGAHQNYDTPDSWHGRRRGRDQYVEFRCSEDYRGQDTSNMGWDFNQTEQPSSTFQQPDSSQRLPQTGNVFNSQGNGYWTQSAASYRSISVKTPVPSQYHDSVGQIHPDSLTNDNEEDYERKSVALNRGAVSFEPPASTAFVQAHEISSNCSFAGAVVESQISSEPPREVSQRPHRGKGPPKKRRPEIESESDNEAEAGIACKRDCIEEHGSCVRSKESKLSSDREDAHRPLLSLKEFLDPVTWKDKAKQKKMPPYFDLIEENVYLTERKKNKSHRDIKRMQCECSVLSREDRARGVMACGEDCLNRLLMIECSSRCLNGTYCSNRRFQMKQHADFEVILTESKGWGLRAAKDLHPNTFVLEYCGEVLDHKEFKSRVKEYARSKNIHYYFMALKNNEIIDATLKGNCSRFMNHSCEPNCETQKWTVNGQLRVGFFTTKAVKAGTELTFDYQFQRYGKEAQKCFCGAPSCRGFLGGENRVSVRAAGGKKQRERSRKKETVSALTTVDEELEALRENGEGLSDEKEVISLCRLMVRVETMEQRLMCLKLIQNTQNHSCLKQFLDHHGLSLLWIFMVDLSEAKSNSVNNVKLQLEIMKALAVLPISTKNMLEESRVLQFIQRWAQSHPLGQHAEQDGYSSESTSRAQTPLNTPDGPPAKLASELDGETPKRAVYRPLKIISENSLDSALSDGSKASDCKEEEDEEEEEMMEQPLHLKARVVTTEKGETTVRDTDTLAEDQSVKLEASDAAESMESQLELRQKSRTEDAADVPEAGEKPTAETEEMQTAETEEKPIAETEEMQTAETEEMQTAETEEMQTAETEEMQTAETEEMQTAETEEMQTAETEEMQTAETEEKPTGETEEKPTAEIDEKPTEEMESLTSDMEEKLTNDAEEKSTSETQENPTSDMEEKLIEEMEEKPTCDTEKNQCASFEEKLVVEESRFEPEPAELSSPTERTTVDLLQTTSVKTEEDGISSVEPLEVTTSATEPSVEIECREPLAFDVNAIGPSTLVSLSVEPSEITVETAPSDSSSIAIPSDSSPLTTEHVSPISTVTLPEKTSDEVSTVPVETTPPLPSAITVEMPPSGTAAAEGTVVGTPSQDEEEGVSDVESERSQEPQVRALDISEMAARLLDSWKDLKEVYRIPKKSQVEKESNDRSREREALFTPRNTSSSRERERERDRERERERDRDWERERDWERDRDSDRSTLRSAERKRRRGSASPPPPSAYERSSRRNEDRYDQASGGKKKPRAKESRNKLTTEERRKLFEQEVAQREAQKQQQQLQRLAFNPLVYTSSAGFMTYPPGYPIQTYVDPTNPNAGKVLLPTPPVEPMCVAVAGSATPGSFEQAPPTQTLISDLGLAPPPSPGTAQTAAGLTHTPAPLELPASAQPPQFAQPAPPPQDPGVAVLAVPAQAAAAQVQGQQGYATLWDPNTQQAVTVQTQPAQHYSSTAQPQTAIYYQSQPCQAIYGMPAGYTQTNAPVIQAYTEPAAGYLHGQQVYAGHQQGVVVQQGGTVTTIVTSQTVQQEMIVPNSVMELPPPSPPKPKTIVLPPNWKAARDPEGKIYYYHVITRQTQWDPPSWDGEEASVEHEAEMDLGTPTYDENPSKFSTKTAEADTSSELAKKSKEVFRKEMSQFIVQCLNPYRKPDCKMGRISNTEDFKHLARKLTHGVMNKELKSCKNPEDLECNENVKHKTKEYIKKYMQKFGTVYRPKEDPELD
ncbi:histone-lysine N-methyltransferase SETD2 [Brachyhypopomus gauderio]|uniref:histone-lysine N-methyltransferase SETD2 n=1 Tax=Brachyhypopomus gauderio TaxID=698409 RepID=UPI004042BEE9